MTAPGRHATGGRKYIAATWQFPVAALNEWLSRQIIPSVHSHDQPQRVGSWPGIFFSWEPSVHIAAPHRLVSEA